MSDDEWRPLGSSPRRCGTPVVIGEVEYQLASTNKLLFSAASVWQASSVGLRRRIIIQGENVRTIFAIMILAGSAITASAEVESGQVNIYGGFAQNVIGNERSVIITNVRNEMDAFPAAERYCNKYKRSARFSHKAGTHAAFDCIQ